VEVIEFIIKSSINGEVLSIDPIEIEQVVKNDEIRGRLNAAAAGYQFDESYFHHIYEAAFSIWQHNAENELIQLVKYVNEEKTIKNPLGFMKSKIKEAWEIFQKGATI